MKISFAVFALIGTSHAQLGMTAQDAVRQNMARGISMTMRAAAKAGADSTAGEAAIVVAEKTFNDGVVKKIDAAVQAVPASVSIGNNTVTIDTAKVQDVLRTEQNFWKNDAQKIEQLPRVAILEPLEKTKLRIAASMSAIIKPLTEAIPLVQQLIPDANKCKAAPFLDCVWKLPRRERRGPKIFSTKCAVDNFCQPDLYKSDNRARYNVARNIQGKEREMMRAVGRLGDAISRDFDNGLRQASRVIEAESRKWVAETQRVMVNDFGCDKACIAQVHWDHVNPIDFATGRCSCKLPAAPGAVVDWEAQDFSLVTVQEWIDIAEDNGIELVEEDEVTELVQKAPAAQEWSETAGGCQNGGAAADSAQSIKLSKSPADLDSCKKACGDDETCNSFQAVTVPKVQFQGDDVSGTGTFKCYLTKEAGLTGAPGTATKQVKLMGATVITNKACFTRKAAEVPKAPVKPVLPPAKPPVSTPTKPKVPDTKEPVTPPVGGTTGTETPPAEKPKASSNVVWWVVGVLGVLGLAGGVFMFLKKRGKDAEGGGSDVYTRFIDEEVNQED